MNIDEARSLLAQATNDDGPVSLSGSVLSKLTIEDVPDGASFQVGTRRDNAVHLEWNGCIGREGARLYGEADHTWTRKYWYSPLGLEQYIDLVRRAAETRRRVCGDVEITHQDDDGAWVALNFRIDTPETNLGKAFESIRKIEAEVEEAAQHAADEVSRRIAEVAARLSGWGSESLDSLVDAVTTAKSADDKGRTLEELTHPIHDARA